MKEMKENQTGITLDQLLETIINEAWMLNPEKARMTLEDKKRAFLDTVSTLASEAARATDLRYKISDAASTGNDTTSLISSTALIAGKIAVLRDLKKDFEEKIIPQAEAEVKKAEAEYQKTLIKKLNWEFQAPCQAALDELLLKAAAYLREFNSAYNRFLDKYPELNSLPYRPNIHWHQTPNAFDSEGNPRNNWAH